MYDEPYAKEYRQQQLQRTLNRWSLTEVEVPELVELRQLRWSADPKTYCDAANKLERSVIQEYRNSTRPAAAGEFVEFKNSEGRTRVGRVIDVSPESEGKRYTLHMNFRYDDRGKTPELVTVPVEQCRWLDVVWDTNHPYYIDCSAC